MTSKEFFIELKKQAENGFIELSLTQFGQSFGQIQGLFTDLTIDIGEISILSQSESKLKIKAFSKDFLFKKTLFKNESVAIEAEFTLINEEVEIFAICKLNKSPNKFSKLPGIIGDLLKPLDFISIDDLVYIFTTKDILKINSDLFPKYSDRDVNLKAGINLACFIDLKNSGNVVSVITKPLKPVIGEGPYFMSWSMKDKINVDFSLNLPKDIDIESLFKIKQPKLVIKPVNPVQISIDGLFDIQLPPLLKVSVLGGFSYTTDGVRGRFNLDNVAEKIPMPFGYPGVHLTTLTVSAGISSGIPNVGAEGDFYIGPNKPDSSSHKLKIAEFGGIASNQYKFIFDAIPGKVTPKFFYMYLDKLSISEYLKALTNKNISLPSFLDKIALEQLMFHWCEIPQGEPKPDGTIAVPIFGFSSIANIFGHRTFTELNVDATNESYGRLVSDPIDIGNGLLKITGNGKGTPEKYKGATKVRPGGMEFSFSSTGNPSYLSFSAKIEILGLSGEVAGDVKENGISGTVKSNIGGVLKTDLAINLSENNFDITTDIYAGISGLKADLGNLGSIKLDTNLEGGFSAKFFNGKYTNKMNLHFMLLGINFDLGELDIEVLDLKKIVKILEDEIIKAMQKLAQNVLAWLMAAIDGIITFAGDVLESVGRALNEVFDKTLDDSAKLMKEVGYQARQVGEALSKGFQKTEQELAIALKNAGYIAEEVGEVIKDILKLPAETGVKILQAAGYTVIEIGRTLKNVYGLGEEKIGEILKSIGASAAEIANFLKDVLDFSIEKIADSLKNLNYPNDVIAGIIKIINPDVKRVGDVLINVLKVPQDTAEAILRAIGFKEPEIEIRFPRIPNPIPDYVKVPYVKAYVKRPYIKF